MNEDEDLRTSRTQYDERVSAIRIDECEVDECDVSGLQALIAATYAIRRADATFDDAIKGSAVLGPWDGVRPSLTRLTMLTAGYLRMHLQMFKHYVSGMQGKAVI